MFKWLKRTKIEKTETIPDTYENKNESETLDDILSARDELFKALTKRAMDSSSEILKMFISQSVPENYEAYVKQVERIIPNVIKLTGTCYNTEETHAMAFSFVLPVYLIELAASANDITLLTNFVKDFQPLLESEDITEDDILIIMTQFVKNKHTSLSSMSEYGVKMGMDIIEEDSDSDFNIKALTDLQKFMFNHYKNNEKIH